MVSKSFDDSSLPEPTGRGVQDAGEVRLFPSCMRAGGTGRIAGAEHTALGSIPGAETGGDMDISATRHEENLIDAAGGDGNPDQHPVGADWRAQ